jgi:hypothetical protein
MRGAPVAPFAARNRARYRTPEDALRPLKLSAPSRHSLKAALYVRLGALQSRSSPPSVQVAADLLSYSARDTTGFSGTLRRAE